MYDIPPSLVVDIDQIGIYLVSVGGKTWKRRGTKHVKILGIEDKRQITMVVCSKAPGLLLSSQVVFTGTTTKFLPKDNEGKKKCLNEVWNFTFLENH